jgi:hypothetical protein
MPSGVIGIPRAGMARRSLLAGDARFAGMSGRPQAGSYVIRGSADTCEDFCNLH